MTAGSEAFQWIEQNADYMLEVPDEAFDWIHMLTSNDWRLVEDTWHLRTSFWREAFVYIVCEGPAAPSRNILLKALQDENDDVAVQAAESLNSQAELGDADWVPLDPEIQKLVEQLVRED